MISAKGMSICCDLQDPEVLGLSHAIEIHQIGKFAECAGISPTSKLLARLYLCH